MKNQPVVNFEAGGPLTAETGLVTGLGGSFASGYGSSSCLSVDICPDLLFAALAAAAAAGFYIIYNAITVKGRRKRSLLSSRGQISVFNSIYLSDVYHGMCSMFKVIANHGCILHGEGMLLIF